MPLELLSAFFFTALLLGLTPGPDNIFVLSQSIAFGRRAGLLVMLGLCSGLIMHTSLVALGLAALIADSEQWLLSIKLVGAGYLGYLAWLSWREHPDASSMKVPPRLSPWQLYRRGIIMNASNPKVAVFFLAFLPQFVDVSYGAVSQQIMLLGMIFILSTVMVFGAIAVLAGSYSERVNCSPVNRRLLSRLLSVVFILLAVNLIWTIA